MEFKKKTIIWEDNNEPPKDYIWVKSDGKAYEYSYSQRKWIESKLIKAEESGSSDGGGSGSEDSEFLSNVLELLYTPGIQYNFLTTDNIYGAQPFLFTKEEYQSVIEDEGVPINTTIGDYDTASKVLICINNDKQEFTAIYLTEEQLNLLKEVVKTPQTITMKEYLETMIEFQYPNGYIYNNREYPVYIPDLVYNGNEYVSTNIPMYLLNVNNLDFAYSTKPFNDDQRATVICGFDSNISTDYHYVNKVLIRATTIHFEENNGVFKPRLDVG